MFDIAGLHKDRELLEALRFELRNSTFGNNPYLWARVMSLIPIPMLRENLMPAIEKRIKEINRKLKAKVGEK